MILIGASPGYLDDEHYTGEFNQLALNDMYGKIKNNYYARVGGFSAEAMENPDNLNWMRAMLKPCLRS